MNDPQLSVARPGPNDPCWCRSGLKYKKCHREADARSGAPVPRMRKVKAGRISPMRTASPLQSGHIPRGLLKLKCAGVSSPKDRPQ